MKTVDVLLAGKLLPGADPGKAIAALAKMTGQPPDRTLALLTSGKPRLFRAGLNQDQGEKMVRQFAELGIAAIVRPQAEAGLAPKETAKAAVAPKPAPKAAIPPKPAPKAAAPPKAGPQAKAAPKPEAPPKPAPKVEAPPKPAPESAPKPAPAPKAAAPPAPEASGDLTLGRPAVPTPFSADYDSLTLDRPDVPSPTVVAVQPPDQPDEELDLPLEEALSPAPPERPSAEQEAVENEDSVRKTLKIEKESPVDQETVAREPAPAPEPEPEEEINPYAAPKANLHTDDSEGEWADSATVVPAMSAVEWLRDAWLCLAENPKVWAQIILCFAGIFVLAFSLHIGSGTLVHVVCPFLAAHLALLVYRQTQDFPITVQDGLLATKELKESVPGGSYRRVMLRMLGIGLITFLYNMLAVLLFFLLMGFKFLLSFVTGSGSGGSAAFSNSLLLIGGALLLYLLLQVLLFPLAVFSPTLVAVADRGVFASIRQSLAAGLKNWQALGVLLAACFFAAVVSCALALLPGMALDSGLLTAILFGLLFGCLWAFLAIAGFFATQDVFGKEE